MPGTERGGMTSFLFDVGRDSGIGNQECLADVEGFKRGVLAAPRFL